MRSIEEAIPKRMSRILDMLVSFWCRVCGVTEVCAAVEVGRGNAEPRCLGVFGANRVEREILRKGGLFHGVFELRVVIWNEIFHDLTFRMELFSLHASHCLLFRLRLN
jgi:hypothetical protein